MSGTSVDAIDAALVDCTASAVTIIATHEHAIPAATKQQVAEISHSGADEIERMGVLDRELGRLFAEATLQLLTKADTQPRDVAAIGSHGQTIRHRPRTTATPANASFTLQIGDPNTIAEHTGITTVADFRRRDIAAGGQGAPLAPTFHAAVLGKPGVDRAIVNIGGIANVTLLAGCELRAGFDTGPGNTLLDHWIQLHRGQAFDRDGSWSAGGRVQPELLHRLLADPFFRQQGPRSTGKEAFNLAWLHAHLDGLPPYRPQDVQATLLELTATSIAAAIQHEPLPVSELYVCGGGSHNKQLVATLAERVAPVPVASTAAIGIAPDWVEAATFAWLASRTLSGLAGNSPVVTGASGERVLGAIYPGTSSPEMKPGTSA